MNFLDSDQPIIRQAPAKLNLFLHVTGRRHDGYHLLQSVFVRIDWCDVLEFQVTRDGNIFREDVENTIGKRLPSIDLSVLAAKALRDYTNTSLGVRIRLSKHIPIQAGLGGGSSDAATTLLALNDLWQTRLTLTELISIGASLGADIPFFLHKSHAWVEGIGENVRPLLLPPSFNKQLFLVVKPLSGIRTPTIFAHPNLVRNTKTVTISDFAAWTELDASRQYLNPFGCNDLQPVALEIAPEIKSVIDWFKSLGLPSRMTGSGSAFFAPVPDGFELNADIGLPDGWVFRLCRLFN